MYLGPLLLPPWAFQAGGEERVPAVRGVVSFQRGLAFTEILLVPSGLWTLCHVAFAHTPGSSVPLWHWIMMPTHFVYPSSRLNGPSDPLAPFSASPSTLPGTRTSSSCMHVGESGDWKSPPLSPLSLLYCCCTVLPEPSLRRAARQMLYP